MKKILLIIITVFIASCFALFFSKNYITDHKNKETIKNYKELFYRVSDYKHVTTVNDDIFAVRNISTLKGIQNLLTQKGYNSFLAQRDYPYYQTVAYIGRFNIILDDITITKGIEDINLDGEKRIFYNYDAKLKLISKNNVRYVHEKGKVSMIKINNAWKIDYDYIDMNAEFKSLIKKHLIPAKTEFKITTE